MVATVCCAVLAATKNASAPDKAIAGSCMPAVLATLDSGAMHVPHKLSVRCSLKCQSELVEGNSDGTKRSNFRAAHGRRQYAWDSAVTLSIEQRTFMISGASIRRCC